MATIFGSKRRLAAYRKRVSGRKPFKLAPLKRPAKIFALAVCFVLLGYFAFDFFVGGFVAEQIIVFDTEGSYLESSGTTESISIFPQGSDKAIFEGLPSGTFRLRKDSNYLVRVQDAKGLFKPAEKTIAVGGSGGTQKIFVEKRLFSIIKSLEFPEKVFLERTEAAKAVLFNNGDAAEEIELVFESDLNKKATELLQTIAIEPERILVPPKGEAEATISIQVSLGQGMEGEIPINGSVRIKYLKGGNSEKAVSFIVSPAPGLEFKPKTASLSFAPGDTETKRSAAIEIANKGSYSLEEISLGIEVDEPRAKTGWFSFEPRETIFDLAAKEKRKIQMVIDAPLNAPKMSFTGRIKASYQSFPPEYLEFSIELSTAQPLLKTRLPTRFFEAQKSQLGNYSEAVFTVSAENLCDCMLASIRLETGAECSGWARLPSPSIETIEAKASASVPIVITAPASAPTGAMQECQLSASYLDPIDGRRKKVVEDFLITAR